MRPPVRHDKSPGGDAWRRLIGQSRHRAIGDGIDRQLRAPDQCHGDTGGAERRHLAGNGAVGAVAEHCVAIPQFSTFDLA